MRRRCFLLLLRKILAKILSHFCLLQFSSTIARIATVAAVTFVVVALERGETEIIHMWAVVCFYGSLLLHAIVVLH